jgi:uncharacterized membrane protein
MMQFLLGASAEAFRSGELAFARGWPMWLFWTLLLAGLVAVVVSLARRQLGWWRSAVLGVLQMAFLAIALVLLWRPVLRLEQIRERQNVVAVLVDDSGSMNTSDSTNAPVRRDLAVSALQKDALDQIAARSDVRYFSFSDHASPVDSVQGLQGGAQSTSIGEALNTVTQMAASVPLAAVVLVTDGADTTNSLDEAEMAHLATTGIPVHTVGVGPEQPQNDLELTQLQLPSTAVAGSTVRATLSIRHQNQKLGRVRLYDAGRLIAAQDVQFNGTPGLATVQLEFPAGESGVRDLRAAVDAAPNETRLGNNERHAVMEVDGTRRSVLYIEGEPRWEYKFIRRAVEGDRKLRLASAVRATPNRYYRQGLTSGAEIEDGFPTKAEDLFVYSAVIIGSLEAAALSTEQQQWLKEFVDRRGGSLLMLAGRDGLGDGGWGRVAITPLLPSKLPGGSDRSYGMFKSQARLTQYGRESVVGRLAADDAANDKAWKELPPLTDYQDLGELRPGAIVLLEAVTPDGKAAPLLVTQRYGRGSTWLLATSSTWHWQMSLPKEDQRHETFWKQLLYTLVAPSMPHVSLQPERSVYEDGTAVTLEAEVLDKSFMPVPEAELKVEAKAPDGKDVPARIEPSGRGDGRYTVAVDARDPGLYQVRLTATAGGETVGEALSHVRRVDGVLEQFGSWQHRPMLERIARETGGRYWALDDLAGLPEAIRYSHAGMVESSTLDLWNAPLGFLLLALLKGSEWLLRRRWRRL